MNGSELRERVDERLADLSAARVIDEASEAAIDALLGGPDGRTVIREGIEAGAE